MAHNASDPFASDELEPGNSGETPADNPLLNDVIERNILTINRLRRKAENERSTRDRVSDGITEFSGSMPFITVHILWFGVWIAANGGHLGVPAFDPFPYGLLTMIVSLEAIFLSTFVLLSQNRSAAEAQARADLDLQIGLLTEHELTRVLQMLDAIQDKLGIENDHDSELAALETETHPEEVLAEIVRVGKKVKKRARFGIRKPQFSASKKRSESSE